MTSDKDSDPELAIRNAIVCLLPRLRRFCLALTASQADADDLCQSTCERAITKLDQWMPGTRLDSWLYRIAQNLHKNHIRDRDNRQRILADQIAIDSDLTADGAPSVSRIDATDLKRSVLALPQDQREVLILICVAGYSYRQCAEILAIPPTTVTNRLFQARLNLRNAMRHEVGSDQIPARSASA